MPKLISKNHVFRVCQPGTVNACAFLSLCSDGWECMKNTEYEKLFQAKRMSGAIRAINNNCSGVDVVDDAKSLN